MNVSQQIVDMLQMQDAMNTKVSPSWKTDGFEWYRAAWIEAAEMMDHYGWKWWKKQSPDREQVLLELVDIWHFCLSSMLAEQNEAEITYKIETALREQSSLYEGCDAEMFRQAIEDFALRTLENRSVDLTSFLALLPTAQLGFDELYRRYVGKNVLNFFRQDKGYKQGSYIKIWQGREDNEHLAEIVATEDSSAANYREAIYAALEERYPAEA